MSHRFDFQSVEEKAFIIQNIAVAGEDYGYRYRADYKYKDRFEQLLSRYTIEIAATTRMVEDTIAGLEYDMLGFHYSSESMDKRIRGDRVIGEFESHDPNPASFRTCLNKIIHARKVHFLYRSEERNGDTFEYWGGDICFEGEYYGDEWCITIYMEYWCDVVLFFYEIITSEIGWYEIYDS